MRLTGLVGWRGMVGSVLMQRMMEERDFDLIDPVFFTTSQVGSKGPAIGRDVPALQDARNVDALKAMDVIRIGRRRRRHASRGATTPAKSSRSFAPPAGTATGSTRRPRCE